MLSAKEVINKDGENVRLVKIRNPWKKGEWKGRWSDNSDDWTEELRFEL